MDKKDMYELLHEQIRYALTHHLLRHPVIWGVGVLFLFSICFLAFGTIKVQSLAIDIDQQIKEALDRSLTHIKQASETAQSTIERAKEESLNRIQTAETAAKTKFDQAIEPAITQGLEAVHGESRQAVNKIKTEGTEAVYGRVRELHEEIDMLQKERSEIEEQISELQSTLTRFEEVAPSMRELLTDWESAKNQGQTWRASLIVATKNWRGLALELFACGIVAVLVSFIVARLASKSKVDS